ncbi:MAG TPA: ATP-binding protein [Blastocatellia bacterium]|nr:ATP-binding protein [Blastocatellia bacterium]
MTTIEKTFNLEVPPSPKNLALVREFVTTLSAQVGLDNSEIAKIERAVDEACDELIQHASGHKAKEVFVRANLAGSSIAFEIIDTGKGLSPAKDNQ